MCARRRNDEGRGGRWAAGGDGAGEDVRWWDGAVWIFAEARNENGRQPQRSGAAINDDDNVDVSADGGAVVRCRRRRRGGNNERGGAHFPWPCRIEYAGDANEKTEERGEEREGRAGNVQDPFSAVFRQ